MPYPSNLPVTAFDGVRRIASGAIIDVIHDIQRYLARAPDAGVAVFDDATGERIELDWSSPELQLVAQLTAPRLATAWTATPATETPRGPGRPRLGVVAREVTLLPVHWSWLNSQPGGASATLRKLVDEAQKVQEIRESVRRSQEAAYRFMVFAAAGLPGYDEALRAMHAGDPFQFDGSTSAWPEDVRLYARQLAFPVITA
jgi:uncharacterized protein